MIKKILKTLLILLVITAIAIGGIKVINAKKAKDAQTPKANIYPVVVSKMSPKTSAVKLTLPYLAEVENDKDVKLASRIAARVLYIKPTGSSVQKGEVVVKLDTTDIQSSLQSIKEQINATHIRLNNLKQTHKRTLNLLRVKGASIEQSQKEESSLASIKASLGALKQKELALKNGLSYATITSPVNGIISKNFVNQGGLSAPAKPLLSISAKDGFFLLVRVPSSTTIKGVIWHGNAYKATALGTTFNGLSEYRVYINDTKLTTGDRVEVDVIVYNQEGFLLPFDAILNIDGKSYVLEIEEDKAVAKEVHILQSGQEGVVVAQNLKGKDIVVAKSDILLKLTSGYPLKVKE